MRYHCGKVLSAKKRCKEATSALQFVKTIVCEATVSENIRSGLRTRPSERQFTSVRNGRSLAKPRRTEKTRSAYRG